MDFDMKRQLLLGDLRLAGIVDERVLAAIRAVPREAFVPASQRHLAYAAGPVSLGLGRTLMPTAQTAHLLQGLRLQGTERVLEIGTGSGYEAALLGHLAAEVHAVETSDTWVVSARQRLAALDLPQVQVHQAGSALGWPDAGPYEAIIVTLAAPVLPAALVAQLAAGGRMIVPIGSRSQQQLILLATAPDGWRHEALGHCTMAPWHGPEGWPDRPMQEAKRPWF